MADYTIVFKNETGGGSASSQDEQPTTATEQAKKGKPTTTTHEATGPNPKAVAGVALAVNAATNIYTGVSNMQASLSGNSAYQARVNLQNQVITSAVTTGTGIAAAFVLGGPVVGGVATAIAGGVKLAQFGIKIAERNEKNEILQIEQQLSLNRLGNAENIWRK